MKMQTSQRFRAPAPFALAIASLAMSGAVSAQSSLFVKVEDLSAPGARTYEGADIEAIELLSPSGTAAYYASAVIDSHKPANNNNADIDPATVVGQPVLVDWDVPYVFSMNGGWVIAEISVPGVTISDEWRLTVYEVDGALFPWGDAPEPYRVSVADGPDGPWRELGTGSGTARFTLDGGSNQIFDDEMYDNIVEALAEILDNEPVTEKQRADAGPFVARINALDDIPQLQTELVGLYTFFNYTEHVVNEHGERDGGRVLLTRALLDAAWQRYRGVTGSGS